MKRLAAILAADVAGYSRLMALDDRATIAALDAARAVFRDHIARHHGRVVDMAGDAVLAVFGSAAGAVAAALAVQQELEALAASVPEERRMRFRIGVHLGDVVEKTDGSVYGDGVNLAARLEGLAEPGGLSVSDSVWSAVKGQLATRFEDQGRHTVRNIAEPVRVYRAVMPHASPNSGGPGRWRSWAGRLGRFKGALIAVASAGAVLSGLVGYWTTFQTVKRAVGPEATTSAAAGKAPMVADPKSIAILPFTNMSSERDNAFFADGMQEELLTRLSLLRELKVVSRTSVMDYRDSKKNMRQIGSELGVRSLVEGSVRRIGNQVRVTAQLIDATTDQHLWSGSFDRELKDVLALQSELASEIARALKASLSPDELTQLGRQSTVNPAAYDLLLRHQELVNQAPGSYRVASTLQQRIALLQQAVALDPAFAQAWARLAAEHARMVDYRMDMGSARPGLAREALSRAKALAPGDPGVMLEEGNYHYHLTKDFATAARLFEDVLRLAPNNVEAHMQLGLVRKAEQRNDEFAAQLEQVLQIDPRNARALTLLVRVMLDKNHLDRALAAQSRLMALRPDDVDLQASYQAMQHSRSGSWDAYDAWRARLPPNVLLTSKRVWEIDLQRAVAQRQFDIVLRLLDAPPEEAKAEWDSLLIAFNKAYTYLAMGRRAQAEAIASPLLAGATAKLKQKPDDLDQLWVSYRARAVLGQGEQALAEQRKQHALAMAGADKADAALIERELLPLYALVGRRQQALDIVAQRLKQGERPEAYRNQLDLAALWDDPAFRALTDKPAEPNSHR